MELNKYGIPRVFINPTPDELGELDDNSPNVVVTASDIDDTPVSMKRGYVDATYRLEVQARDGGMPISFENVSIAGITGRIDKTALDTAVRKAQMTAANYAIDADGQPVPRPQSGDV